jgi:Arc/MetJ family transcription regulator
MQQIIMIDDELLNNATHCLAIDDINEIVNIALHELIKNHPVANIKINQPASITDNRSTDDLASPSFNPKQFFAVSHLKNTDKQLEEMRNEWERY